ncbi:RING/FYVE/PHD zinc finger superfamily protein [Hirschfeldia incana]|nr:RING/FYVE/PHD zinc finger superfamily protein [Hirschfeldia incana]
MGKESQLEITNSGVNDHDVKNEAPPRYSSDKDTGLPTCRVCQCAETDRRGDAALGFLGITPPVTEPRRSNANKETADKKSGFIELISPDGEVFVCADEDIEMGAWQHRDTLLELGCSCKNDLALVHYACALKWFVNHGSTVCEICGNVAVNIRTVDVNKVVVALKDYAALRERTADGDPNPVAVNSNNTSSSGIDPDAVAAIRRQRLSEISLWFGPHCPNNSNNNNSSSNSAAAGAAASSQVTSEQPLGIVGFDILPMESRATKWAVEGTGILLATGLLTVTLAWLIAPRVGKRTAKSGLHILLGGLCALTVVIFFRFVVLTRIKYGPARYWAILFVFWFLVFGIWASRSHAHTPT